MRLRKLRQHNSRQHNSRQHNSREEREVMAHVLAPNGNVYEIPKILANELENLRAWRKVS